MLAGELLKPTEHGCLFPHIRRKFSGFVVEVFCQLEHNSLSHYLSQCGTGTIWGFDFTIPMHFYISLLQVIYSVTFLINNML